MGKRILIFSDGTGQIGGMRPDQRLSNVYKMYRAMRSGPDSPISPKEQIAFYDAGLGTGEVVGGLFTKIQRALGAGVGNGIDENIIDCYEKIIAYYEPGDEVLLFGFSRGAYTVRSVANVMNLCGIPTKMKDGSPIPRYGDELRKIASDAVKYVYNHGAGRPRGEEPYYFQREEKGRRFREKYACSAEGAKACEQGNVQPTFVGVYDTVAALDSKTIKTLAYGAIWLLGAALAYSIWTGWPWYITGVVGLAFLFFLYRTIAIWFAQWKYFSRDPNKPRKITNPLDWWAIWRNGHWATWSKKNYDRYLDSDVQFARHALSIDEARADFPRVAWGSNEEMSKAEGRNPAWLKQVWFAGCHSHVGGSYPEDESRLSDIPLEWMVSELKECLPSIQIREDLLNCWPDAKGLQHAEVYFFKLGPIKIKWRTRVRKIAKGAALHSSVLERLKADNVPQLGVSKLYRPSELAEHSEAGSFFTK
ncbi:T6SS phospholipase effector Tle1-like catalytic domain-containing protein [Ciceribacter thiooxidans]|uniref:Phospholipase effector Tle1 domain-containing protein n=1 Tax=Ciceribacter thiooxidans TaxID=1969821 RepID=A0ABV7IBP1_9HYPH|nr:DUF2235 domain-containing protein [Ciceribacter thiooxidans]